MFCVWVDTLNTIVVPNEKDFFFIHSLLFTSFELIFDQYGFDEDVFRFKNLKNLNFVLPMILVWLSMKSAYIQTICTDHNQEHRVDDPSRSTNNHNMERKVQIETNIWST